MSTHTRLAKLEAVIIETPNLEELADFYVKALKLDVLKQYNPDHLGIWLSNIFLGFDRVPETDLENSIRPRTILWFWSEDIQRDYERLLEQGARIKTELHMNQRGDESYAELFDPEGNVIGLIQKSKH